MKRVCAWCQKELPPSEDQLKEDRFPVTHGICNDCVRIVMADEAVSLKEFLGKFSVPILLVDSDARVKLANDQALTMMDKKPQDVEGELGGDVFSCRYASLPGGCGHTIHCKSCTIRRTVTDTALTGRQHVKVEAYQELYGGPR